MCSAWWRSAAVIERAIGGLYTVSLMWSTGHIAVISEQREGTGGQGTENRKPVENDGRIINERYSRAGLRITQDQL